MSDNPSRSHLAPRAAVRMLVIAGLAFARVLSGSATPADRSIPVDRIDALVREQMAARNVPGLALAVLKEGKVLLTKAYGSANLETETPVTTSSVFELASLTKPFTATAVMLLAREGKVRLDDSITLYLDNTPPEWKPITVRHLLSHTGGFGEMTEDGGLMDITTQAQYDYVLKSRILFQPGTRAQYSDPGYFLLGMIIEKAAGLPYARFLEERIFRPLGMTSTSVLDQSRIIKGRVAPYAIRNEELVRGRRDWQHQLPSFFGIYSSVEDLAKWESALVQGTVLPRPALEEMWAPTLLDDGRPAIVFRNLYGLGWQVLDHRGHRAVAHGGFTGTFMLRFPDDGLTVIILSNLDLASGNAPDLIAQGVAGLVDPRFLPAHLMTPVADPDPARTQKLQRFLRDFGGEECEKLMTAENRRTYLAQPKEVIRQMSDLYHALSPLVYLGEDDLTGRVLHHRGMPVIRVLYYRSEFRHRSRYITVWLDGDGRIADLLSYPY